MLLINLAAVCELQHYGGAAAEQCHRDALPVSYVLVRGRCLFRGNINQFKFMKTSLQLPKCKITLNIDGFLFEIKTQFSASKARIDFFLFLAKHYFTNAGKPSLYFSFC